VAVVVGADTGTVKSRLFRARQRLRRSLAHYLKSGGEVTAGKVCR
jgi:DNA-directed RNA polymerase specialized sigma24 family protein